MLANPLWMQKSGDSSLKKRCTMVKRGKNTFCNRSLVSLLTQNIINVGQPFMDVEVWGFKFEEAMHFFPIDVSDLEPNRGLQTRYCCWMIVDFDHRFLIPVKLLDLIRNIGIAGSSGDRLLLLLGKFCCQSRLLGSLLHCFRKLRRGGHLWCQRRTNHDI